MNNVRVLRPVRKKLATSPIAVFDFETKDWSNPYACGVMYEDPFAKDIPVYRLFKKKNLLTDLVDFLTSLKGYTIFAHYGGKFDILFMLSELLKRTKIETKFIVTGSSVIAVILKFPDKTTIRIFDSWRIFQAPLADIGKAIGLPKLDMDHDSGENDPRWKEYLYRDCEILFKAIQAMQRKLEGLGSQLKPTAASTAMETFRRRYLKETIRLESCGGEWLRPFYCGGRVEAFKTGIVGPVYVYDVNSMYPHVMRNYRFPIGIPTETRIESLAFRLLEKSNYCGFVEATVKCSDENILPILPLKTDGKLLFPIGTFRGVWDYEEIKRAKASGYEIIFHNAWIYTAVDLFSDYVDDFYKMKSNGGIDKIAAKLFLNSLYGKFGEGNTKSAYIFNPAFESMETMIKDGKITRKPTLEIPELNIWSLLTDKLAKHTSVPIAAHVTALARCVLWDYINEAYRKGAICYYCDTDSLFLSAPVFTDSAELGGLKLEGAYNKGIIAAPKMYALTEPLGEYKDKVKAKGFRRLTVAEFRAMLKGSKVHIKEGVAQFKSIIRRAKNTGTLDVWCAEYDKGLASDYTKRRVLADGNTYPLIIENPTPSHWKEGIYKELRTLLESDDNDDDGTDDGNE